MATRVWGPHTTGGNIFGLHIGATTDVTLDDGGSVPAALNLNLSGPLGGTGTTRVANGNSTSITAFPGVNVTATVNNCQDVPAAAGMPDLFVFQVTLRAAGNVRIGPISVPVNAQIDAFDVHIAKDPQQHAQLSATVPRPA